MENIKKKIADELFEKARRGSKEALHELKILGNNNDAEALSKLAEIYLKGLGGFEQLPQKAIELLEKAAALDYPPALYRLGDFYYYGKGSLTVESQKAVEYLTKAAELGEWKSYKLLGEIYLNNEGGIEADGYKVIDYMLKYAEEIQQNELPNIFNEDEIQQSLITAANIYLNGKCGVTQNGYKAIEIFAKAEDWWEIAWIYRYGKAGVAQSGSKAIEYFSRIEGWSSIAEIYAEGCGDIVPNRDKAIEFYERAGDSYKYDVERLTTDKENLQELITLAESNDAKALCELAEVYLKGLNGLEQSPQKAIELLEKAAALDYPPALESLGDFYLRGKCGVKQSGQKAVDYFIKDFEENNNWESKDEIVEIYWHGCGEIKPDGRKAFEYDCAHNFHTGFYNCCVFDEKLGYIRRDGLKILDVLNRRYNRLQNLKAPDIVIANELIQIAEIYEEGYGGLAPNREKAIEFYKKCTALLPGDNSFKNKLAYLTAKNCE